MYDTIRRLFVTGRISERGVEQAVIKGYITKPEADAIIAEKAVCRS